MEEKHFQLLLKNPEQEPTEEHFMNILDKPINDVLKSITKHITAKGLDLEWRYYKDGTAWLGKVVYRKKTVVWLSVWDRFIKASFYFTEKTRPGVLKLDLNDDIKSSFADTKPLGKLIPLIVDINGKEGLNAFKLIVDYKMNLL